MKRNDWLLITGLALIALALMFALPTSGVTAQMAEVSVGGAVTEKIMLGVDGRYLGQGALGAYEVEVVNGTVKMLFSACPDQLCVRQGAIARSGQSIVCLPNQVSVTLSGESDLDAVVH